YISWILLYHQSQLVFVDESSADQRTTYRGLVAQRKAFFVRDNHYSILPGISLDGTLHVKIIEGSFNSQSFDFFISHLLDHMNPWLEWNSVIVMDNCSVHKDQAVLNMIVEHAMRYEFSAPYSLDFNLIRLAFSAIKAHIQRN
ncbi:hypothetical protein M422DRAFT_112281, partial [Sphaerobolus stellatus SS14]